MRSRRTGPGGPTGSSARSNRPGTPTAFPSPPRARCGPDRSEAPEGPAAPDGRFRPAPEGSPGRESVISYDLTPERYRHWVLTIEPPVATLTLAAGEEPGDDLDECDR